MLNNPYINQGQRVNFTCVRCGKCCSSGPNVALTIFDACRIARFLNKNWRELIGRGFYAIIADYIPILVLQGVNDKCVFLKTVNGLPTCTIYPARPMRCRLYPFIPVSPTKETVLELSTRCPGLGKGSPSDPPWADLKYYLVEVREHYALIYDMIFNKGLDPVEALEKALDIVCSVTGTGQ